MLPFRKHREKTPLPPKPKWLIYGVISFVALLILQAAHTPKKEGEPNPVLAPIKQAIPDIEPYKTASPLSSGVKIKDVAPGAGPVLLCGQKVNVTLQTAGDAPQETTLEFTSGDKEYLLLTQLISTMHVSGAREVELSKAVSGSELAADVQGSITQLRLTLNGATPEKPELFDEKKLMLELMDTRPGSGATARCGDTINAHITLYGSNGMLKTDVPTTFTIGSGELMLGIEQGVIGMREGGKRTLVLPPAWQERLHTRAANAPAPLTTPSKDMVVAKITLLNPLSKRPYEH